MRQQRTITAEELISAEVELYLDGTPRHVDPRTHTLAVIAMGTDGLRQTREHEATNRWVADQMRSMDDTPYLGRIALGS